MKACRGKSERCLMAHSLNRHPFTLPSMCQCSVSDDLCPPRFGSNLLLHIPKVEGAAWVNVRVAAVVAVVSTFPNRLAGCVTPSLFRFICKTNLVIISVGVSSSHFDAFFGDLGRLVVSPFAEEVELALEIDGSVASHSLSCDTVARKGGRSPKMYARFLCLSIIFLIGAKRCHRRWTG